MENYLDTLFWDIFRIKLNNNEKEKCLFEFGFTVEKVLFTIFIFSQKYNINMDLFYDNIDNCTYNEIL